MHGAHSGTQPQIASQPKRKSSKPKKPGSIIEQAFAFQLGLAKLPVAEREYRFHPKRLWRFDFAWPTEKVAVECEGGVWIGGRHTQPSGFVADCEKYNAAALLGWRIFRFTPELIKSGAAIGIMSEALA